MENTENWTKGKETEGTREKGEEIKMVGKDVKGGKRKIKFVLSAYEVKNNWCLFERLFLQKRKYLQNDKRYAKKKNAIVLYPEKPFK